MMPIDATPNLRLRPSHVFVAGWLWSLSLCSPATAHAGNEAIYQEVDDRVVCIHSTMPNKSSLTGAGFFIAPNVVATVAHQVADAETVMVYLADGQKSEAKYLIGKPDWDVALIQVPQTSLKGLRLEAAPPGLGNDVFTIGCPMDLDHSLSRGVVSNPNRHLDGALFIQTDLVVNNGNSGGPLFNQKGDVIGLIKGSFKGATGLNFAVPAKFLLMTVKEAGLAKLKPATPIEEPPVATQALTMAQLAEQLAANPDSPEINSQIAAAYFAQNRLAEAKYHFQKALESWPEHHQILTNLGYVLHKLGQHDKAKEILIKAISIDPNFSVAYLNLGMVYANGLNNNESARTAFTKFLGLDPNNPKAKEVRQWMESHQ